jgi:hypothetical protein
VSYGNDSRSCRITHRAVGCSVTLDGSRVRATAWQLARHRTLRDVEPEGQEFAVNARRTPGGVLQGHPDDELPNLRIDSRPARVSTAEKLNVFAKNEFGRGQDRNGDSP